MPDSQFALDWSLFLVTREGNLPAAKDLISRGANPNFIEPASKRVRKPSSVLSRAVACGHLDVVSLLLESGAVLPTKDLDQEQLGRSALSADAPKILSLLLQKGLRPIQYYQDWAQEQGHDELYRQLHAELGDYRVTYDIDALLASPDFLIDFYSVVPEWHSIHDKLLFPEERVVRDVGDFVVLTGNAFTALIEGENLDVIARSRTAFAQLGDCLAARGLSALVQALKDFGISVESAEAVNVMLALPEPTRAELESRLRQLDQEFFHGPVSIWNDSMHVDLARDYARTHLKKLRGRKP